MLARSISLFAALTIFGWTLACGVEAASESTCGRARRSVSPIFGGASELAYLQASEQVADAVVLIRFVLDGVRSECTGFLIHAQWVVTAAHCAPPGATGEVLLGSRPDPMSPPVSVHQLIRHPSLDVLLIELSKDQSHVTPIGLFNGDPNLFRGEKVQNAGFGATEEGEHGERRFAVVTLNDVGAEVLTTTSVSGSGACEGDSGGPLLTRDSSGQIVAIGILTRGSAACNQVDEYVRVDLVHDWILQFVEISSNQQRACDRITAKGRCFGTTALWCDQEEALAATACNSCGWDARANGFRCVKQDPCSGVDDFGTCSDSTTREYCSDGRLIQVNCECDERCSVSSRDGCAHCVSAISD